MKARKNVATLSAQERQDFVDAVIAVRQKPSIRGLANRWDDFVRIHVDAMMMANPSWGHGGSAFTAWHRVLLIKFEQELQTVKPSVTIPYWDWTVDRTFTSPPWLSDLLGGDGGPSSPSAALSGEVTSGPLRHSAGNWNITNNDAMTNDDPFSRAYLARGFTRYVNQNGVQDATQLPTAGQQSTALGRSSYSLFRQDLEVVLHNLVHRWVGGQMLLMASPNDPVFWMHHANIDRLWGIWMFGKPAADRYTAPASAPSYHQPTGNMIFYDPASGLGAPWSGTYRPIDTIADHTFGVWYDTDPPVVTLQTPSVAFQDVEQGSTTYRAIVFDVQAVQPVSFQVTSSVPAPFGLPPALNPPAPVQPGDTAQVGRVWLSFTAGALGAASPITVTVHCVETNENFNVQVTANVVPQRTAAIELVADRSGSMAQPAGNGLTKRQKLGQALHVIEGLLRNTDQVGLVTFDDQVAVKVPLAQAQSTGGGGARDDLGTAADSADLDPRGLTSIGGGIQLGATQLAGASGVDTTAMIVVTDGVENTPPMISQVSGSITSQTFAVGIGRPADISTDRLRDICQNRDGYLLVTGDLAAEEQFRLHKYFLQVHASATNQSIVLDPSGELTLGQQHAIRFAISEADYALDAIVLSPAARVLALVLEAPDGTTIDLATVEPTVQLLEAEGLVGLRLQLPALAGQHPVGEWTARLSIDRRKAKEARLDRWLSRELRKRGSIPYSFVVQARSDLTLRVRARQRRGRAQLVALLDAHGIPFWDKASVVALVTDPDRRRQRMRFKHTGDGRYEALLATPAAGLYTARVIAEGALAGQRFTREQAVSLATVSGQEGDKGDDRVHPKPPRQAAAPSALTAAAPQAEDSVESALASAAPPEPAREVTEGQTLAAANVALAPQVTVPHLFPGPGEVEPATADDQAARPPELPHNFPGPEEVDS